MKSGTYTTGNGCRQVVVESDEPRSKRQKLTDFFERLPSSSQPQEFPCYLRHFQPTHILRHTARLKRPVGRPKKSTSTDSTYTDNPSDENNEIEKGAARGVYQSHTQRALPIIRHLGFPVANLHFNLQLFRREIIYFAPNF